MTNKNRKFRGYQSCFYCSLSATGVGDIGELAYVQYMELKGRWTTPNAVNRNFDIANSIRLSQVKEGEDYGMVTFGSIVSTFKLLRSSVVISSFN